MIFDVNNKGNAYSSSLVFSFIMGFVHGYATMFVAFKKTERTKKKYDYIRLEKNT